MAARPSPRMHGPRVVVACTAALLLAALGPIVAAASDEPPLEIAYIPAAAATCYDTPMLAGAQTAAAKGDANLTVLVPDDPASQAEQLREAVDSGAFDGIVVQPPLGPGLVAAVEQAIDRGVPIANVDRVLGDDMASSAAQVEGLAANVVFVPSQIGRKLGQLAVEACAGRGAGPCRVAYLFAARDAALGDAIRAAFDEAVALHPSVSVVAEAADASSAEKALTATRELLAADVELDVIVGSDQAITGALQAVDEAGRAGRIDMVGYGGGAVAVQGVLAGERYATIMQLPGTEGRLVVEHLIAAIRTGEVVPGIDPLGQLPDEGIVRADNAASFTAEWPG
ncbi:MAG: sugar ABC transporter substrate-binding protein [Candidatus Limnocylindrales bacterium]